MKYKMFVESNYVRRHPLLYNIQNWEFEENLLQNLQNKSLQLKEEIRGVYSFPLLKLSTCNLILDEVSHFEEWCLRNGLTINRPNSMNNYGAILDDFGFKEVLHELTLAVANPLSERLFPHIGNTLDNHHGFMVEYAMNKDLELDFHVDESDVTLNICLGKEFKNGELFFGGVRCAKHQQVFPTKEEQGLVQHKPGTVLVHLGKHRHAAKPITEGHRLNLILWNKSSKFRQNSNQEICPNWCPIKK